jgi:hypothetical protein
MKEPLSCAHFRPYLLPNLHKLVQGLNDVDGVDSLAPGYLVGEHHPLIVKGGQSLGRMDNDMGLNRTCCPILKPQFLMFLLLKG